MTREEKQAIAYHVREQIQKHVTSEMGVFLAK